VVLCLYCYLPCFRVFSWMVSSLRAIGDFASHGAFIRVI
jgi:hypothetical protein